LKSSRKPTPRSATRIECYIPESDPDAYDIAHDWLCDELAYAHGGCSSAKGIDGRYLSFDKFIVFDNVTLVWCDLPWRWTVTRERAEAAAYAIGLRSYLSALLPLEEVIYIVLTPVLVLDCTEHHHERQHQSS
jgi:hypothetical protein